VIVAPKGGWDPPYAPAFVFDTIVALVETAQAVEMAEQLVRRDRHEYSWRPRLPRI